LPEWVPAFLPRSFSKASTRAGASPAWDNQLSPLQCFSPVSVPATPQIEADVQNQDAQGPRRNPSWLQVRKVFVGGVPQSMDQKEFYKMFSSLAKVKMAWLQMFHNDHHESRAPSGGRKHRGFGFVVFSEKHAVDQLLGDDSKRFLEFDNGLRLEVKRAVGKETPAAADTSRAPGVASALQRGSPSSIAQALTRSPMSPLPEQCDAPASFPYVPPFPTSWSPLDTQQPQGTMVTFVPLFMAPCPVTPQTPPQQHMVAPSLYDTLLNGFVGQKPCNPRELEYELLRAAAATEQYED